MDTQKGKCWQELVQRFGVKALPTDYLRKPNRVLERCTCGNATEYK